jgi:hypothetical protein
MPERSNTNALHSNETDAAEDPLDHLRRQEPNMRMIAFAVAAFVAGSPAVAQEWKDYTYPDYAFTVAFPAAPQVETTTYQAADNRSVPAHVYAVRQDKGLFKMTVADLAGTGLAENAVIDHAVRTLTAGSEVKVDIPHRIYKVYGRQLSIVGADGSHSTVAVFDYNGRLYQIEGKSLPGGSPVDVIRFQQSLVFTDGGSNRSEETIRAIRQACRNAPSDVVNPAGVDDPRCRRAAE